MLTTWNSSGTLATALEVLLEDVRELCDVGLEAELLIFDQGSTDGTQSVIRDFASQNPEIISITLNDNNIGQCKSRNIMCKLAKGRYLVLLDGDIVPIRHSICYMVELLEKSPGMSGVCYDIRGDSGAEHQATPAENPIIQDDVEMVNELYFHYAMYRREWFMGHLLPEFWPFDGPGWGVEEDVCLLQDPSAMLG